MARSATANPGVDSIIREMMFRMSAESSTISTETASVTGSSFSGQVFAVEARPLCFNEFEFRVHAEQGLRMADKKKGFVAHRIPKTFHRRFLCGFVEINEHIPAKDNVQVA
jgi:hypothetical protein